MKKKRGVHNNCQQRHYFLTMAMNTTNKVIVKVLIDKEKYQHFLLCEKFYEEHNQKLKQDLKLTRPVTEKQEPQESSTASESHPEPETSSNHQVVAHQDGAGIVDIATKFAGAASSIVDKASSVCEHLKSPEHILRKIPEVLNVLKTLENFLKKLDFSKTIHGQQGQGVSAEAASEGIATFPNESKRIDPAEDGSLLPQTVNFLPRNDQFSRPGEEIEYHKGKLYDQFDTNHLISKVPEKFRQKATTLIGEINKSSAIDFDKSGNIFVFGNSIPNANIDTIFPYLFSNSKKTAKIPGLKEFIIALSNNNLGHFVVAKRFVAGMKRPRNYVFHPDTEPMFKKFKNWWYLGN